MGIALNDRMLRIDTSQLSAFLPPSEGTLTPSEAAVPDIALIYLSSEHQGTIEARGRTFYSIEKRKELSGDALYSDEGYLVVSGSPIERIDYSSAKIASFLYDTNASHAEEHNGWDYLFVNLNVEDNPEIPANFEGVSGGGLWRVKYAVSPDRSDFRIVDPVRDIVLVGVNFFQTASPGRQLIAHGPRSIYERLYDAERPTG